MRKIAGYLTKNRSEKDQKIAQSTHENGYIKPRKTFWRNSKQLLNNSFQSAYGTCKTVLYQNPFLLVIIPEVFRGCQFFLFEDAVEIGKVVES
ncbi:hypothetical protein B5F25_13195 [Bacteroides sp. An19]|nr:hypothetical protein B5F25_13195 [Bacteroides sp. An19]